MIAKLREAGLQTENQQENAKFSFMVRPMTSPDIDCIELATKFEQEVFARVIQQRFVSSIKGIIVFPKIIDPAVGSLPEQFSFKKREEVFFISDQIDYNFWKGASDIQKVNLIAKSILSSITKIPSRYLGQNDKNQLLRIVEDVHENLRSKFIH